MLFPNRFERLHSCLQVPAFHNGCYAPSVDPGRYRQRPPERGIRLSRLGDRYSRHSSRARFALLTRPTGTRRGMVAQGPAPYCESLGFVLRLARIRMEPRAGSSGIFRWTAIHGFCASICDRDLGRGHLLAGCHFSEQIDQGLVRPPGVQAWHDVAGVGAVEGRVLADRAREEALAQRAEGDMTQPIICMPGQVSEFGSAWISRPTKEKWAELHEMVSAGFSWADDPVHYPASKQGTPQRHR